MPIDRKKFMTLAFSMWLAPSCAPTTPPPDAPYGNQGGPPPGAGDPAYAPAPADECTQWDPSGECIGWASQTPAPANECVQWDPSGECIGWAGQNQNPAAPADECVEWDPTGECIRWEPRKSY